MRVELSNALRSRPAILAAVVAGLATSGAAFGFPWDIDMADSQTVKGYEQAMSPLPVGVVAQPNMLSPFPYTPNFTRGTPEGEALVDPFGADAAQIAMGERMYATYCTPCHGDGVILGLVAAPGRYPAVAVLAGPQGRVKLRTDGWVYLTVRNGGGLMPAYGWAMTDEEMWSIVRYVRTLPDSLYRAPNTNAPAAPAEGSP